MNWNEWKRIRIIDNWKKEKEVLKEGDTFLTGKNMIGQTEVKRSGQEISYYEVIRVEGNNTEYVVKYDILKGGDR